MRRTIKNVLKTRWTGVSLRFLFDFNPVNFTSDQSKSVYVPQKGIRTPPPSLARKNRHRLNLINYRVGAVLARYRCGISSVSKNTMKTFSVACEMSENVLRSVSGTTIIVVFTTIAIIINIFAASSSRTSCSSSHSCSVYPFFRCGVNFTWSCADQMKKRNGCCWVDV